MDTLIYCMYVLVDFRILIKKMKQGYKQNSKQKIIKQMTMTLCLYSRNSIRRKIK